MPTAPPRHRAAAPDEPAARTITEITGERDLDTIDLDAIGLDAGLLVADTGEATIINHSMREDDVRRVPTSSFTMIGSAGVPRPGPPSPRWVKRPGRMPRT